METDQNYRIETKDGKLFCKCRYDQNGNPILMTKNAEISLQELMKQAYTPDNPGRLGKKHKQQADPSC